MLQRMIVKDAARNVTVTVTLVVLMTLSVMMATASAGLLARLTGASDRLMTAAEAPHVAQMHAGPIDVAALDRWAQARPDVQSQQAQLLLGIDNAHLAFAGANQKDNVQQNSLVVPNATRDLLLSLDGGPLTAVEPGTIWLPVIYHVEQGLEAGDAVSIATDGFHKEFRVAGFVRDAIMNTGLAGSKRLAVSPADLAEVQARTGTPEHVISFWLKDPATQLAPFKKAYLDDGQPSVGPMVDTAAFNLFNMMSEGMVAGVVILASVLLLAVGLLCMRLSFLAAVQQDQREIGVLTAIGVEPRGIRRLYQAKYGAVGAVACILGLLAGWALAPLMSRSLVTYLGDTSTAAAWLAPAVVAIVLFGVIWLFIQGLLRKVGRASAVEALRAGTVGSGGKSPLRLHRSPLPTGLAMGLMDVARRPTMYLLLLFVFAVSAFIGVVPASAASTLRSPEFVTKVGVGHADATLMLQHADGASTALFDDVVSGLTADPSVSEFVALTTTRHDITTAEGTQASLYVANGNHQSIPVAYAEGRAPATDGELALSLLALAESGYRVGDTVTVVVGGQPRSLAIVGSYQDITNGGKTGRAMLPTDGGEPMWYSASVRFVARTDIDATLAGYAQQWAGVRPWRMGDFQEQQLGPIGKQITQAAVLSAGVALALAALMTAMFTRMLLAGDASQVAIQRALGAPDASIRSQYLTRILVVLAVGVPLGIVGALTMGEAMFNLFFEGMFGGLEFLFQGTSRIQFDTNPWLTAGLLPAALLAVVALAVAAATRTIRSAGIASLVTE